LLTIPIRLGGALGTLRNQLVRWILIGATIDVSLFSLYLTGWTVE
jgi:hypothetical protein